MKEGIRNMMKDLVLQASLLISALFVIGQFVRFLLSKNSSINFKNSRIQVMAGLSLGTLGTILMYLGITIHGYVIVDLRHIPIIIAATFFGLPSVLIASLFIAFMRIIIGGLNEFTFVSALCILLIGISIAFASKLSIRKELKVGLYTIIGTLLLYINYYVNLTILSDNPNEFGDISLLYWAFSLVGSAFAYFAATYMFSSIELLVELDKTKLKLSTLISNLNSGVVVESPDRRIELANDNFYKLFRIPKKANLNGLSAETLLLEKSIQDFDEPEQFLARIDELVKAKDTVLNEEVYLLDGRIIERDFIPIVSAEEEYLGQMWNFREITQRKESEKRILDSKENYKQLLGQYQSVIENVKEVIFQTDTDGNWTFLNKSWTEITGYRLDESIGQPFLRYVHEEERQHLKELFDTLIREQKDSFKYELRYITKDGVTKWIEMFARLTLDEKGEIIGTSGSLFDITQRKLLKIKIIENEQLYKSLFEYNQSPSYLMDRNGVFTQVNDATFLLTGYTREELVGTSFVPLLTEEFVQDTIRQFERTVGGESLTFETAITQKNGTIVCLNINITPIIIDEKITGVIGMAFDITKEKVAERKLIESENRYRSLIDLSPEVIFVHSRDQIEFINQQVVEFIGAKKLEDLLGKTVFEFLHPDDRRTAILNMAKGFTNKSLLNQNSELRFIRFDGKVVTANVGATLIEYNGKPAIMGVIHDITEKKETERKLLEANELLQKISSLDGLTGIPNRRFYDEMLKDDWENAIENNQTLSLLMIDIDYFKLYNDTYGHQQGDYCLQEVAKALQACVEQSGDFIARYGGEEFSAILRETSNEHTLQMAEKLRSTIEELKIPHLHSTIGPYVTISVGVATFHPNSDMSVHDLIQHADRALYETKRNGRNSVHTN